ncbi:hypothetical protein ZOSMA_223G00040 [Zostera marina]|uniref:F-box domain-containing protein n=1 Tax=Zostera marina TaxID=29655 RepID=A0A0K9PL94_ZOSMR|nr:hypothetical protein ZOSMA_223G00040 [Zostera marina]
MAKEIKKCKLETEKDIISSMPEDITNRILGRLPIRDIINTSTLSREWRYKWRSMPDLIFDNDSFHSSNKRKRPSKMTIYLRKILRFLSLHRGNIRRFEFSSRWKVISSKVDMFLDHLSFNFVGVQHLKLTFTTMYLIPPFVFRFDKLTALNLNSCKIILPASFNGFKNLKALYLRIITFANDNALETLINLCPLLEILDVRTLLDCRQRLILHAPNLKSLTLIGSLSYLEFKKTQMVTQAALAFDSSQIYDLTNVLRSLSNVDYLVFWNFEDNESAFKKINFTPSMMKNIKFNKLKKLFLGVNLDCSKQTSFACCVLENCPSINYFRIHCDHLKIQNGISLSTPNMFWKDKTKISSSFDNLKIFDVVNLHGSKSELKFIEYIFAITPSLEVSNIEIDWEKIVYGERVMCDIAIELLSFKKASGANVIIEKP